MEVEFTVLSDRREGLLRELGGIIIQSGFSLLRQRMSATDAGVQLWLRVGGSEDRLLELEERLSSHPLVLSFESEHQISAGVAASAPATPVPARSAPPKQPFRGVSGILQSASTGGPAVGQIEVELSGLAKEYPRVFPRLLSILDKLPEGQKTSSMEFAGRRVGAWAYKRDYALGGKLGLSGALKQIALPALRSMLPTDLKENSLRVKNNPLCMPGSRCRNGDFICGFLKGLLEEAGVGGRVTIREIYCRSDGSESCVFEVVN